MVAKGVLTSVVLDGEAGRVVRDPVWLRCLCVIAEWVGLLVVDLVLVSRHSSDASQGRVVKTSASDGVGGLSTGCEIWKELGDGSETETGCSGSGPRGCCAVVSGQASSVCRLLIVGLLVFTVGVLSLPTAIEEERERTKETDDQEDTNG